MKRVRQPPHSRLRRELAPSTSLPPTPAATTTPAPSLPTGMELILEVGRQDCASGEFMQDGWRDSMKERCKWWCEVVNCTQEPFLLLDADVQLF